MAKQSFSNSILKITDSKLFPIVFIPIAFVFVLIFSTSTSPLFVSEGLDSCVFKTMGQVILQGKTPYVDFFDHKGPVIYFINALGQLMIPGSAGILILQVVGLSLVFFFLFRTARLFVKSHLAFIITLVSIAILSGFYDEGNHCEEWELIAIAISFYYTLKYFVQGSNSKFPKSYSIILGCCLAFTFFIRPNDAVSTIGGLIFGLFIYSIYKKQHKDLFSYAGYLFLGFFIVALPILLFFISRHALGDLYYGLIKFNSLYAGGILSLLRSCVSNHKLTFFILFFAICVLAYNTKYKATLFVLVPVSLLSLLLTGGRFYSHYFLVFTPIFLLFFCFLLNQNNVSIIILSLALFYCCSYGSSVNYIYNSYTTIQYRFNNMSPRYAENHSKLGEFYKASNTLLDKIPKGDRDSVWNYNLMFPSSYSILYHYGIIQCNRIALFTMPIIDPSLQPYNDINLNQPKWILVSHENDNEYLDFFKNDYNYIVQNYTLISRIDSTVGNVELYQKN